MTSSEVARFAALGIAAGLLAGGCATEADPLVATGGAAGAPVSVEEIATTSTTVTEPPTPTYVPFEEVDPNTSYYFISLETTPLAESQGEERLYNLGVSVCQRLDKGASVEEELASLTEESKLESGDAGALVGAAVTDICDHHGPLVEDYLEAASDGTLAPPAPTTAAPTTAPPTTAPPTTAAPTTAAPTTAPPTTAAPTTAAPTTTAAPPADTYYANCDAARAAGAAPLSKGQPGYRSGLDRDGDGIACET